MNTIANKGNWHIAKGKLRQQIAQLTDDELQFFDGKEDEFMGRNQKRPVQFRGKLRHLQNEADECHSCQ